MGLDQYAYIASQAGDDHHSHQELAYWRKHPNLQGWMEQLWLRRGGSNETSPFGSDFNGVELELTWDDLDKLEHVIRNGELPTTSGFFFGNNADDYYREQDLEFVKSAKAEVFLGRKVFYNSSW